MPALAPRQSAELCLPRPALGRTLRSRRSTPIVCSASASPAHDSALTGVELNRLREALLCTRRIKFAQVIGSFEAQEYDLRVNGMRSRELDLFLRCKFNRNALSDFAGYLGLYSQNIAQIPLVTARPQMAIGSGVNQLRGDADLAA